MSGGNDGGAAFPCEGGVDSGLHPDPGMSLRDYFAGRVLAGIVSGLEAATVSDLADGTRGGRPYAAAAYRLADAMLAEREKSK